MRRKINITPHKIENLNKLSMDYVSMSDVFSLHHDDTDHTYMFTMDVDAGDHPCIVQKPCTLPLKHT